MKKILITFTLFALIAQAASAFVVFDKAAAAMSMMTKAQLQRLNNTGLNQLFEAKKQLEQLEQQYLQLGVINDELNSVKNDWDDIADGVFSQLNAIAGADWIDEFGLYNVFGGLDVERMLKEPARALNELTFLNAPFAVDLNNMDETYAKAMDWAVEVINDGESTDNEKGGAVVLMADVLASKYHSETEASLKTVEALANTSNELGEAITAETNVGDNMAGMNKQATVTNNLIAEQIRQEREANEVLITTAEAEAEILRMQERRARERARAAALQP